VGPITQPNGSPETATIEEAASPDPTEAARLARDCDAITQALKLARWIEEKPRPVTPGGVLRKADVQAAGAVLGITVPARLRTASDVPALHLLWLTAVAAGLIQISGGQARAGSALTNWPPADTELLTGWLGGLRAACADSNHRREERPDLLVLAMLVVFAQGRAPTSAEMWLAVNETAGDLFSFSIELHAQALDAAYRFCGPDSLDPMPGLFALLTTFGAVTTSAGKPQITTLGRWAQGELQASLPLPVSPDLPAAGLLARMASFEGDADRRRVARGWLKARTPTDAVREILAAADQASPSLRFLAIGVAHALGDDEDETLPAWQEMTGAPRVGPYARTALTAYDESIPEADRRWLAVDRAAAALAEDGQDEALTSIFESFLGSDLDSRLAAVRATTHPDAEMLARSLSEFAASGAPWSVDQVVQVKVALARTRPAVWRRVVMPATSTLSDLHWVIKILYGWTGHHMHDFKVRNKRYSNAIYGLEDAADEEELRLPEAFGPGVRKITYTYDFGAWRKHEITLERQLPRQGGKVYPVCVAFQGDSPVEYEDEDEPAEPEPFSMTQVNQLLQDQAKTWNSHSE